MHYELGIKRWLPVAAMMLVVLAMSARQVTVLQGQWTLERADMPGQQQTVTIPHTWNAQDGTTPDYYRGQGIYRCLFDAPAKQCHSDRTFIRFEGVSQDATVWLNGRRLGRHQGAFTAFGFELTQLLKPHDNELRVEVSNAADPMIAPLEGDFTIFGGIYRPVSLMVLPATCFTPLDYASSGVYISQDEVSPSRARLTVKAKVDARQQGDIGIRTTVIDPQGKRVMSHTQNGAIRQDKFLEVSHPLIIDHPMLWDGIDNPQRYRFLLELLQQGRVVDTLSIDMGLRYFSVDPDKGFFLNGRSYPLRGVNRHQDRQGMGWAITEREHDEDMAIIQEIGANCIRLAHYPHSDYFYTLCDRAGMMVWAEIPYIGKGTRAAAFDATTMQQLIELIRQNYNHESIFCWSLFNELGGPDRPHELVAMLNDLAHREDPTRLTVAAANNDGRPENDMTDIMAYNTYPGWYWADPGTMRWAIEWKLGKGRAIGISEYGAGASIHQHDQHVSKAPKTDGPWHPEEWQATVHEGTYAQIAAHPALWGSFVWNMFDFASAGRHEGDAMGINDKGLVTYDRRTRKDAFYFYQAQWSRQPMVHITSSRHTPRTETTTDIKVYSNCPNVKIMVNGTPVEAENRGMGIFIASNVTLQSGDNNIVATAQRNGTTVTDSCTWTAVPPTP